MKSTRIENYCLENNVIDTITDTKNYNIKDRNNGNTTELYRGRKYAKREKRGVVN
jgi:hypothetical protein